MMTSKRFRSDAMMVFLLSAAVLSLEIALTRIFSFTMYHHFTYLVISVALLGFGAAGTYLTVRTRGPDAAGDQQFLGRMATFGAATMLAAVLLIPRIHFYPIDMYYRGDYSNLLSLWVIILLAASPFFFAGACIAFILSRAAEGINRVYFADLAGGAMGCLLVLFLINKAGAIAACFICSAMALLAAALATERRRTLRIAAVLVVVATAGWVAARNPFPLYVPRHKQMFGKEHLVEAVKWHVTSRLDVTRPVDVYHSFGGALSDRYEGPPQRARIIYQDGTALTGIIQPTSGPLETASLGYYLQGAAYQIRPDANVLVIGCGGGPDIMIALHHAARHVVGVDINPQMINLLHAYGRFANNVFERDDVELVVSEGRHFLSRDERSFDVIQLSGVDTSAAQAAGAYALSENFIYTVEAFKEYYEHLNKDGIVNFSRPRGWQTLRIIATWMQTFQELGVPEPWRHMMVLNGKGLGRIKVGETWMVEEYSWAQTLVKRSPFTPQEVEKLRTWTEEKLGFEVLYDPYKRRGTAEEELILADASGRRAFIKAYPQNIVACRDDKPFYFQCYRWENLLPRNLFRRDVPLPTAFVVVLGALGAAIILSALFILYPLFRHTAAARQGQRGSIFFYFACLGIGFIFIEIGLLQRLSVFLGGPAYSISITLFTILLASGIGSFLSRNWSGRPFRLLAVVIPLLAIGVVGELAILAYAMPRLMHLSHGLRAVSAIAMIAPLAVLMGMPFPTGLRYVDRHRPELNPWAWGVNACATVIGSVVCIIVSLVAGFSTVLLLAAGVYIAGWLIFAGSQGGSKRAYQSVS